MKKELTKEEQALFNELKKLSKRANQRIVRLERAFGTDNIAIKNLKDKLAIEKLQAWTSKGRVRVNKNMSIIQMKATIKETERFLKSPTSTRRGIKKIKQKAIKTIKTRYGKDAQGLTDVEAMALSEFFDDKEVNDITNYIPRVRCTCSH